MIYKYKDLKINYEIFEKEKSSKHPPLLLLHGWMANIQAMIPIYKYFSETRKVIVLDFPGQGGKSDTLKEVWGVPEYSEMVKCFIEDQNIIGSDVIAHSFGGRVTIYLASKYQTLFNRIILTDSAGILPKKSLKARLKLISYKFLKSFYKIIMSKEKYENKLKQMREKRSSIDYKALDSDIMRETFKKIVNLNLKENLKYIKNSTLIVWGENDKDTPIYMAKIMEKEIKDSGLVILENAGHFSYIDNTQKYLLVANEFLK